MGADDRETTVDPLWYKDAVIYELHVKTFCDSTANTLRQITQVELSESPAARMEE